MRAWLRSMRGIQTLALAALTAALAVTVSRGQPLPGTVPDCGEPPPGMLASQAGEPPAVDAPMPGQPPTAPFTPPAPRPLPPEQAGPFVPGLPFPAVEPMAPPIPQVRLHVRAPARIEPDKEIEYHLTVENLSRANAHHVLVRDRLPRGVDKYVRAEPKCDETKKTGDFTDLLWKIGTLKPGEHKVIVLTIKPRGTDDVENRAYVQFEHGQKVTTRVAKPGISVRITAPAQAILYESIPLRIEVFNTGAIPLRNVVLTQEVPAGLEFTSGKPEPTGDKPPSWKLGDLLPRQSRRIDCEVISKKTGTFQTKVKVTADGGASANHSASVTVGESKLKISVSGPQRRLANRPIPYHITVRNTGTLPLSNVLLSDALPRGIDFVSVDRSGRKEGNFVRWSLGNLAPGQRRSLLMVVRAPESGWYWNEATVKADHNLSDRAMCRTHIETSHGPVIEIDKGTDSLDVGQTMRYTISLFNPEKVAVLKPQVIVTVPDELHIRSQMGRTTGQVQGQSIRFDGVEALDPGKDATYFIDVEAKKAGEAVLRVQWTDPRPSNHPPETWEDRITIHDPRPAASGIASSPGEPPRITTVGKKVVGPGLGPLDASR